jgi:soluble lytic murein transglycosylase-like protein
LGSEGSTFFPSGCCAQFPTLLQPQSPAPAAAAASLNKMLRRVSDFAHADHELVRVLPSWQTGMLTKSLRHHCSPPTWKAPKSYRVICDCQAHAIVSRSLVGRTLRGARAAVSGARRHAATLLVGIPLAVGALFPVEAMNIAENVVARNFATASASARSTKITASARREMLGAANGTFSLEVAREDFFRTEVPYGPIIYREALRNRLAPELVAAVVEAESDFRPRLRSEKHAQGLMQIIPETGRLMGARNLYDPSENVRAGVRYLRYLTDRYDGDVPLVLAAYNAGEGNVSRFGGVPPFRETRDYVQRVAASRRLYQKRLTQHFNAASRVRSAMSREQ